jgi:peptidoglycan hydrolase-like protein with peptidoglycan-binding domain
MLGGLCPLLGLAAVPQSSSKNPPKKAAPAKSTATTKAVPSQSAPQSAANKSAAAKKKRIAAAPKQNAPTQDRMREIQQALTQKGFTVAPSGMLDPATADALRRFQGQQNLPSTGKLDSMTLISLGLGPKREGMQAKDGNP